MGPITGQMGQMVTDRVRNSPFANALSMLSGQPQPRSAEADYFGMEPDRTVSDLNRGLPRVPETPDPSPSGAGASMTPRSEPSQFPNAPMPDQSLGYQPADYRRAISSIESAGSGGYAAVGPTHKKLGRALGKYQIMEANIAPWSQKYLGRQVTPQEFLANPSIQDAIFDGEFGNYVKRYGPEKAAQAWFAGEGGIGTSRQDVLGTDVPSYGRRFMQALRAGPGRGAAPTRENVGGVAAAVVQDPIKRLRGKMFGEGITPGEGEIAQATRRQGLSAPAGGGGGGGGPQVQTSSESSTGPAQEDDAEAFLSQPRQQIAAQKQTAAQKAAARKEALRKRTSYAT